MFKGLLIFSKLGFKLGFNDVSYMVSNGRFLKRQFILEENKLWANQKLNKWKRRSCEQVPSSMISVQLSMTLNLWETLSLNDPVRDTPGYFPGNRIDRCLSIACIEVCWRRNYVTSRFDKNSILQFDISLCRLWR